jgi:outer membrane protein assembly factor BamA
MAGAVYADLRYDLIAASDSGAQLSVPLSQEAYGGLAHTQLRVARNTYVGARIQLGKLGTALRGDSIPNLPDSVQDEIGVVLQVNSLGPTVAFDTRDSSYYPRRGIAIDASIDLYFNELGSDVSFNRYDLNYRQYLPVRGHDVLAWQTYICAAGGEPPFFLQCQIGPNSLLRGYSFGEHRGNAMAAAQAEYRWQFHRRWIAAAFAGVAQAAPEFGDFRFDENLYSGGVGLRFVVEPKNQVTLRVDYAVGEDEDAVYVSVGEAF